MKEPVNKTQVEVTVEEINSIHLDNEVTVTIDLAKQEKINQLYSPVIPVKDDNAPTIKNNIFTGEITTAFMASSDDVGTIHKGDSMAGTLTEYRTNPLNGVQFIKNDLFDNTLSPQTQRLFMFNLCKLAQNVGQHETDINRIRGGSLKPFSLAEYMADCGLKDRKKATKIIKESIRELLNTRVNFNVEVWQDGKKRTYRKNTDILSLTIDITDLENKKLTPSEYVDHCIEKGLVYMTFDLDFASVLVHFPLLALPTQLFKIDINRNGHALSAGFYLLNLANMGRNKISIANLIKACPDLPLNQLYKAENLVTISKQGLMKDTVRLYKHILEPLKKTLEALKKSEILKSYSIQDKDGKEKTLESLTKETLESSYIVFKLTDKAQPQTAEALNKKLEHKKDKYNKAKVKNK